MAKIFSKKGYNLVLVARNGKRLKKIKKRLEELYGVLAEVIVKDLAEENAASEIYNHTQKKKIKVDILVNNAGFGDFGRFAEAEIEKLENMVRVNIMALMQLSYLYAGPMIERGSGRILNVASMAAFEPGPLMAVYYASKAFVLSFTEALSVELKGSGVTVTALCPGPTKTGFERNANLLKSGLFKNLKNAEAKEVAKYGYQKMMENRVIAVPGVLNKGIVTLSRFSPKAVVRNVVYHIQK